jgi:hypothetical protein
MAITEDDRQQAERLLYEVERRLKVRDYQITKHGDSADPAWIIDAEDLRRKRAALHAVLTPELPDEISGLVKRRLEDDYFIFQQQLETNRRVATLEEDVRAVKETQYAASVWRLATGARIEAIEETTARSERKRSRLQPIYLVLFIILVTAVVGGVIFGRIYL